MILEKGVNQFGQEQMISNADRIIKIDGRLLQVRLIKTRKWQGNGCRGGEFGMSMPRAKFVSHEDNPYYLIRKSDLNKMTQRVA